MPALTAWVVWLTVSSQVLYPAAEGTQQQQQQPASARAISARGGRRSAYAAYAAAGSR